MKIDLFQNFFLYKKLTKINLSYRNSHQRYSLKKLPETCNFIKKEIPTKVFCWKFCEIFKNTFFTEHFTTTSSFCNLSHSFILQRSFIYLFKPSFVRKIKKRTHNFAIFSFCKFILYSILWTHFTDQNIKTRNHVSVARKSNCIYQIKFRTVITNVK